ncbi:MAG: PDZ domain-containing protein, partial [SAR202 cluster bacterium]|nr:PDZ domain-containing protein [SAR202 cluster bacterium]
IDRVGVSPGRVFNATDSGSGFFIDNEGHILTNYHVISVGDEIRVTLADGRVLPATKLGTSPADDLALLQVDPDEVRDIVPLILADSDQIKTGQLAIAIGSPFGLDNYLSVGVVAGYGEGPALTSRPVPKMVWTNAQLLPGNSGGPLIDSKGAVIGIATAVQVGAGGELGLGFAIPSNIVGDLLSDLVIPQEIKRAWLGISGETLTKDLSDALGLVVDKGVYVTRVWPDSPAEGIGMRDDPFTFSLRRLPSGRGDIIVAADARPIASLSEMVEYFNTLRPGNTVRLTVIRGGGQPFDVDVTLEAWSPGG